MSSASKIIRFLRKEWLLFSAFSGLAATSIYLGQMPELPLKETGVIWLLWLLFVSVRGLEEDGLLDAVARRVEMTQKGMAANLVLLTFILAAVVTNDAALAVVAPLTMKLDTPGRARLVILEALAANAGSALTPFGNPQNLYIFWRYHPATLDFMQTIAPFSIFSLILLLIAALLLPVQSLRLQRPTRLLISWRSAIHGGMAAMVILVILGVLPMAVTLIVAAHAIFFDRRSLRVDYPLLAAFMVFFALSGQLQQMLGASLHENSHVFMLSALASQVMSNVPTALLLSHFTENWQALLWGVNAGGYGTLIASFANLIAWRAFMQHGPDTAAKWLFTLRLSGGGAAMLLASSALYYILY